MTLQLGTVVQVAPSVLVAADGSTVGMPVAAYATDGQPALGDRVVYDLCDRLLVVLANLSGVRDGIPGEIRMHGGATAPPGWLTCDGASYLRTDYPRLFAVIGTAFGSVDSTHFNVPDLRSRFPIGANPTVGSTGGAAAHTHTSAAHAHTLSSVGWAQVIAGGTSVVTKDVPAASWTTTARVVGTSNATMLAETVGAGLDGRTDTGTPGATGSTSGLPPFVGLTFMVRA